MTLSTSAVAVCCCSDSSQFVEQPCVLDRDDRLRGEVVDQLDLLFGERPDLLTVDAMAPISSSSLSIGTRDHGSSASEFGAADNAESPSR